MSNEIQDAEVLETELIPVSGPEAIGAERPKLDILDLEKVKEARNVSAKIDEEILRFTRAQIEIDARLKELREEYLSNVKVEADLHSKLKEKYQKNFTNIDLNTGEYE